MTCLSHLTAHVVSLLDVPTYPFASAEQERSAFAACTARREDRERLAHWPPMPEVRLLQALFENPSLAWPIAFDELGVGRIALSELPRLMLQTENARPWLLVNGRQKTHGMTGLKARTWSGMLPPGSLVRVGARDSALLMPSPEFHLLLRAGVTGLPRLCRLVCEACGTYAARPDKKDGMGRRPPRTSLAKIAEYLTAVPRGTPGLTRMRRAAHLCVERSASPRETALALMVSMPLELGGFNLPKPLMNQPVLLDKRGAALLGYSAMKPDLFWPEGSIAFEYQGKRHNEREVWEDDQGREQAMSAKDLQVVQVTPAMVATREQLCALADRVRKALGKHPRDWDKHAEKQERLRRELFVYDFPY